MAERFYGGYTLALCKQTFEKGLALTPSTIRDLIAAAEECEALKLQFNEAKKVYLACAQQRDQLRAENKRLRDSLGKIAATAEDYNYTGWQRIVGVMQKEARHALEEK